MPFWWSGPATVVEAIQAGKQAARSIQRFLGGDRLEEKARIPIPREQIEPLQVPDEERAKLVRPSMSEENPEKRIHNFRMVELGLNADQCRNESKRCLRCDLGD